MSVILRIFPFFLLIIYMGCASRQDIQNDLHQKQGPKPGQVKYKKSYQIKPGEVQKIKFPFFYAKENPKLKCSGSEVKFFLQKEWVEAFVAETYFSDMKPFECVWQTENKQVKVAFFEVKNKEFPSESLNVDLKRVKLSKKDQKRVAREQKFLNKNYASSPDKAYFDKAFEVPLDSYITSIYGARRVFNQQRQTQHLGTDFRAAVGVPIPSSNAGRVVVARELFYTGLTVTIDHGLGLFTIYGHLSELKAVEGEYLPQGAIVGLAGRTGRTTGPHLHWGVKVNGHFVDGHSLVKASEEGSQEQVAQE